jgi:hypothetical protein
MDSAKEGSYWIFLIGQLLHGYSERREGYGSQRTIVFKFPPSISALSGFARVHERLEINSRYLIKAPRACFGNKQSNDRFIVQVVTVFKGGYIKITRVGGCPSISWSV